MQERGFVAPGWCIYRYEFVSQEGCGCHGLRMAFLPERPRYLHNDKPVTSIFARFGDQAHQRDESIDENDSRACGFVRSY